MKYKIITIALILPIMGLVASACGAQCSGKPPKTESFPLANGSADGGYGIASAQCNQNGATGNAAQAESDAGC